jgi:chorismate mutase
MRLRAIKGATAVAVDSARDICLATTELLQAMLEQNTIAVEQVISLMLTATPDLRSEFPARGARDAGWGDVPMLCAQEIDVPGALPRCIRVLAHVEVADEQCIRHVYLREARGLRPDIAAAAG